MSRRDATPTRILALRLITALIFVILVGQLALLQFMRGAGYQERATFNRTRVVRTPGERGVIYDRDGRILARNTASFGVAVVPADLPTGPDRATFAANRLALYQDLLQVIDEALEAVQTEPSSLASLDDLAAHHPYLAGINQPPAPSVLSLEELERLIQQREAGSAFQPVLVAENLPRQAAVRIEEERYRLPGVDISLNTRREYLSGADTSHIIGYMGPIPQETSASYRERGYSADAWVGWSGLEFSFEDMLRGRPGTRIIEVDVNGRERAVIGEELPPQPGRNLILSLDLELQQAMQEALVSAINPLRSHSAVAIALDPRNGFILGMVSLPTYDNNVFADGITADEYSSIAEARGKPLINHAISGIYPPGSTFKLVPAAAGLEEQVITANTRLNAPGVIYLPNQFAPDNPLLAQPFVCWIAKYGGQHGDINVTEALGVSCDIYFYKLGGGWYVNQFEGLGPTRLAEYSRLFGFGERTGIDLFGEHPGLVPDARWKRIAKGERWVTGDTYNMSIGQGDVLSTPLQVTLMTMVVANDGQLFRPQLVAAITDAEGHLVEQFGPDLIRQIPITPRNWAIVREGMWMAVNSASGTARSSALPDIQMAGKTGTSEFFDLEIPRDARGNLPFHAWFTAFAPYDDPEIVVTVFVYNGGEGSDVAAPITRDIMRRYFDMKAGDQASESRPILERLEDGTP